MVAKAHPVNAEYEARAKNLLKAELIWLRQRLRGWLWRKYDRTLGRYTFFTDGRLHGQYQLYSLPTHAPYLR